MMNRQAELFEDGGLKDEGGMVDRQSGNKVPVGSTRKEVRDDIPAKLSEGEFVMPADVVRYHGLDKMMGLRDEAKMGLRKMDAMGQMGNSEEATMSDEMPFGMGDLLVVAEDGREVEMAEGGYVTMAEGGATRALGPTYKAPTNKPINFTSVMGEGKISYKEYRNAEGKNLLVSFIGGIPVYPIPEGYTEYTPGADEPVTPIQEVVQAGPPTPELGDEDRQRAGYEAGYSIGYENMTPIQLLRESKRMNSVFGKIAFAIPMLINPFVGIAAYTALGDKYPQLDAEINKQLKLDPKNKSLLAAAELSTKNKQGKLAGETVTTIKKFVGDKITKLFGENTLKKAVELSGYNNNKKTRTNLSNEITKVTNTVKKDLPSAVTKTSMGQEEFSELQRPPSMNPPGMGVDFSDLDAEDERRGNYPQQEFEQRQRSQREIDRNARLGIAEQEDFEGLSVPAPLGATPEEIREQILKDSGLRPSTAEGYGNLDAMNRRDSPTIDGTIPFGQFQGERFGGTLGGASLNDQYNFDDAVAKSREIADGPGFVETMRDKNRATVDRKTEERRAERDSNRGDYGFNKIYSGSEVYQPPRTSLIDQIRTGRTDTPDLTDAFAAALGYVYDGTVNGYVGKGAVIANDYLRSLPSAVYDLLGMSFKPAGAATMDSVAGQALSANDMKTVIENNAVGDDISSALRGGYDSSRQARVDGTAPSGIQVAGLGGSNYGFNQFPFNRDGSVFDPNAQAGNRTFPLNEQLRQDQSFVEAGDRYRQPGQGQGRGLRGTRPEGFGDQNLGFVAQDAPEQYGLLQQYIPPFEPNMRDRNMRPDGMRNPSMGQEEFSELQRSPVMVDPRDPNFRGSYQGNIPPSNMQGPNFTPSTPNFRPDRMPNNMQGPNLTPQLDAYNRGAVTNPRIGYESGQDDLNRAMIDGRIPLTDYSIQPETGRYVGPANIPNRVYSPSNEQGPNFTPDSVDSRGSSQIPDSIRPFPVNVPYDASFPREPAVSALGAQPVGTQMLPNVGGTSGRLQDFRGGDPFKPLRGAGIGGSNMGTPDNVTDIATRASSQLSGPTPENYGTQNFNAYGEGVTPGLRQGDVTPYSPNMRDRNMRPPGMTPSVDYQYPLNYPDFETAFRQNQAREDSRSTPSDGQDYFRSRLTSPGQEEFSELQRRSSGYADAQGYLDSGRPMPQRSAIETPGYLDSGGPMPQRSAIQTPGYLDSGGPMPQRSAIETPGYLDSGGPMPQRSARDVPSFGDTDPINVVPANEFQLGAADTARENNLRAQAAEETFYDQQARPTPDPRGRDQIPDSRRPFLGAGTDPYAGINEVNLQPEGPRPSVDDATRMIGINDPQGSDPIVRDASYLRGEAAGTNIRINAERAAANREASLGGADARPRRDATISDTELNFGMGSALKSGQSPVSLNAPSMDMSFDPTRQEFSPNMRDRNMRTPGMAQSVDSGMGAAIRDATVDTKVDTKKSNAQILKTNRKRIDDYILARDEVISRSQGNSTLLRSGKEVPKNSPQDMYNNELESTGYIGTDAEGYGVGMIAGPGQAGVVVDKNGKALKDGEGGVTGKTIYQDSKGQQYTKSTFGKRQTLDGNAYKKGNAKIGDGYDKDTDPKTRGRQGDNEADSESSGKIICTAMNASYGFGSYRNAIWLSYANKHLTKEHEVGYHTLFLPLVYLAYTKDIKFIRTILEHGTRRRTADLRAELKGTKRNTLGRFYRSIFEPLCYTVGKIKIALGN